MVLTISNLFQDQFSNTRYIEYGLHIKISKKKDSTVIISPTLSHKLLDTKSVFSHVLPLSHSIHILELQLEYEGTLHHTIPYLAHRAI